MLALGVALITLASCGKSNSPSVTPTATPSANPSGSPGAQPLANFGVAYFPDGGNGGGVTRGIQVVHFEDTSGNLLAAPQPMTVNFAATVGPIAFGLDGSVAVAAQSIGTGAPFTQLQDVFGLSSASLLPAGSPYVTTAVPTPTPIPSGAPTATPVATPTPILTDVTGIAITGVGAASVALAAGTSTGSTSDGLLGITSLTNAPPAFAGFVPYAGDVVSPPAAVRKHVAVSTDGRVALVRGPSDLVAIQITIIATGYKFTVKAFDATLGTHGPPLRGRGAMAVDPVDASRAIVLQAPGPNDVTLVTGLPGAITQTAKVTLSSRPHSVAIAPNGKLVVIGADAGLYVFSGVDGSTLTPFTTFPNPMNFPANASGAFSPMYTALTGSVPLTNVSSVGFSLGNGPVYLAALASTVANPAGGGVTASLVALPFDANATVGTPVPTPSPVSSATPPPSMFVQNSIVQPAIDQDYMLVR